MTDVRAPIFDAIKAARGGKGWAGDEIVRTDAFLDGFGIGRAVIAPPKPPVQPFDRAAFLARHVNRRAAAITPADLTRAAADLNVSAAHIRMVSRVESGPYGGFDNTGRPIILPEPHIFSRRTSGRYDAGHPDLSYPRWGARPYPGSFNARWERLADMAALDERAALESASYGRFQIMGFHWQTLRYPSVHAMVDGMVASESAHLDALVRFIRENGLTDALKACRANQPDTCRAFAKGYNGSGYERNAYHGKLAEALS